MQEEKSNLIDATDVDNIFIECQFRGEECDRGLNSVEGASVYNSFTFDKNNLKKQRDKIIKLIKKLPLKKATSFLDLGLDKHGGRWAYNYIVVEKLLAMGLALNKLKFALPREEWKNLPLGIPMISKNRIAKEKMKLLALKTFEYARRVKLKHQNKQVTADKFDNTQAVKEVQKGKRIPIIQNLNIR